MIVTAIPLVLILLCFDIFNSISLYIAISSLPKPPASPLGLREVAELVSFCATAIVPVIAVVGGWVAYRQFQAAETTRLVSVYMAISEKWDSDGIREARRRIYQFQSFWEAHRTELVHYPDAAQYLHALLLESGETSRLYRDYLLLMSYLEDIGLMCESDYLRIADVNNFIGQGIMSTLGLLLPQIIYERRDTKDAALYANALQLYRDLPTMKPRTIAGFGL
ncbi:MAG TPA: hypothetical protein VFC56_16830 [Stellaceae bacterium]|nr:hypothetical protein [Stellaceae bacterium]